MPNYKKGQLLFIVIGTIMVVVALSAVILKIMLSQSRLIHHQVSRIQAQYAAKAGIVYALEKLRRGDWVYTVLPARNDCAGPSGCPVTDSAFPPSINSVKVIFCPSGSYCTGSPFQCQPPLGTGINFCLNTTVTYQSP